MKSSCVNALSPTSSLHREVKGQLKQPTKPYLGDILHMQMQKKKKNHCQNFNVKKVITRRFHRCSLQKIILITKTFLYYSNHFNFGRSRSHHLQLFLPLFPFIFTVHMFFLKSKKTLVVPCVSLELVPCVFLPVPLYLVCVCDSVTMVSLSCTSCG